MVTSKSTRKSTPKYRLSQAKIREVTTVRGAAKAIARAHKKAFERLQKD
jgi:hypothetical protein